MEITREKYLTSEDQAVLYNNYRPTPPFALVQRVIDFLKEECVCSLDTVVDMGCGSGQSTLVLAPYFKNVIGVDNCPQQIDEANRKCSSENVHYRLGSSDILDFPDNSVQLVTAGQCAHFFNMEKFNEEVNRVLQVNGVLAIYGYCLPKPFYENISLERDVKNMFENIDQYVSEESKLVYLKNYKTKDFERFSFCDRPTIREEFDKIITNASLEDLIGYCSSWSGFQRLKKNCGDMDATHVINNFKNEILKKIGRENEPPEDIKLSITFKYILLLGRKVQNATKT